MTRIKLAAAAAIALAAMAQAQNQALAQTVAQTLAPHPGELIKQPGFREAWAAAIKGEKFERRDSWIPRLAGPGSGDFWTDPTGKQWIEGNSCQPHNCSDNHVVVLIDPATKKMFATQRTRGQTSASQRYFGKPDATIRRLLNARVMANFP